MDFKCQKTENCFEHSSTYAYVLPVFAHEFLPHLEGWEVRINEKLRRPVFIADKGGVNIKAIVAAKELRVSFPDHSADIEKALFELWLEGLHDNS